MRLRLLPGARGTAGDGAVSGVSHDFAFHRVARIEVGPERHCNGGSTGCAPFVYRNVRLHPADGGEPLEITVYANGADALPASVEGEP